MESTNLLKILESNSEYRDLLLQLGVGMSQIISYNLKNGGSVLDYKKTEKG